MSQERFTCKAFNELTLQELYDVMQLRQEVFVVEQDCPYLDADGKDAKSYHLMEYASGKLVSYLRIVEPGVSYEECSIGRVVTSPSLRGTGAGIRLMDEAMRLIRDSMQFRGVRISAQCYLVKFYQKFGFETVGEEYLEDDIPHIQMYCDR